MTRTSYARAREREKCTYILCTRRRRPLIRGQVQALRKRDELISLSLELLDDPRQELVHRGTERLVVQGDHCLGVLRECGGVQALGFRNCSAERL